VRRDTRCLLALAGALALALGAAPTWASASATTVYEATTGTAQMVRSSAFASPAPATSAAPSTVSRGVRLRHVRARSGAPAVSAPTAAAQTLSEPAALLENFNGVSSRDSEVTNFGQEFEPPDQGLCAGNGFVVEMVNSAYSVYRPDGTRVAGPFNVNDAFDEGALEFTSDPRCLYEAKTHTWIAIILQLNSEFNASQLEIAVNHSGDPTKPWTPYRIDTSGEGGVSGPKHAGCPCFGDQPRLGIDAHNVYVTADNFSILGPQFYGANVYAISKHDLTSLSPTLHFAAFFGLKQEGVPALAPQPAITTGTAPAEYMLANNDPTETSGNSLGVWALTEAAAVETGGKPKLSSVIVASEPYAIPLGAEQMGTGSLLEAGDDRMQQTAYGGGTLWGELDTALNIPGDPEPRDGAAWFEVKPKLSEGVISGATVKTQGYVALAGNYLLYPALAPTAAGAAAMVFTISGATRFPSAAYATLAPGASSWGPVTVAARGTTFYDPTAERWGDYSWAALDPSGEAAWLATEYMPPKASQTTDGLHDWGTRVLEVKEP
jgi:hypothetical protein